MRPPSREIAWGGLLLAVGLGTRFVFVTAFPAQPVSDFASLVEFGLWMRDRSWTTSGWFWEFFTSGLPFLLSFLFRIFPDSPSTAARLATALLSGATGLLPFVLWRGVLPLWVRLLAGGLLALWPGQVFFSGVVAQDNWVLVPLTALACLAVRSLLGAAIHPGHPAATGLLFALTVAIRQEMLVAGLPLFLAAAGATVRQGRWRRLGISVLAAGVVLCALAVHRQAATGRFAISSEHAGMAILGAYIPGGTVSGWSDPYPYIAATEPDLLVHRRTAQQGALRLALAEALRRPTFHAARIAATTIHFIRVGEISNLVWSVSGAGVLPTELQERGTAFMAFASPLLKGETVVLQVLFLAALGIALRRRSWPVLCLSLAILLKIGLHAVTVMQGRYLMAATALQILVIALGAWEAARRREVRGPLIYLGLATALVAGLAFASQPLLALVAARDYDVQRTYRFTLGLPDQAALACAVDRGRLTALTPQDLPWGSAAIEPFHPDPAPGETATADCTLTLASGAAPPVLEVLDPYAPGGYPNRIQQRVVVDGVEVLAHDLAAAPGSGWARIPLGPLTAGEPRRVRIEVAAVNPDPGPQWGRAANTTFRLAPAEGQ